MMESQDRPKFFLNPNILVANRYKPIRYINKGAFGEVWEALDLFTLVPCEISTLVPQESRHLSASSSPIVNRTIWIPLSVAIKVESVYSSAPQLLYEYNMLKLLSSTHCGGPVPKSIDSLKVVQKFLDTLNAKTDTQSSSHPPALSPHPSVPPAPPMSPDTRYPRVHYFVCRDNHNMMILDLLGPSLEQLLAYCGGAFSHKTTMMLAVECLHALEAIHSQGIVHRDLKPANFVLGIGPASHRVALVDFGLSRKYRDSQNKHVTITHTSGIVGTMRYAAIPVHSGIEACRRVDLEALAYVLVYLCKGALPWQGLDQLPKEEKGRRILEIKKMIRPEELCAGLPRCFAEFTAQTRGLGYEADPPYDEYRQLFLNEMKARQMEFDYAYDWCDLAISRVQKLHAESQKSEKRLGT